ncbi:hypothetical protein GOV12_02470 [Candidatus Pacearchaeota archaeon]|nr:hypothetical protein [Candidatus Pacearchaeota archaeon]
MTGKNLVSELDREEKALRKFSLKCISPNDGKYGKTSEKLVEYLTPEAEWKACCYVQKVLLETRVEFGGAEQKHVKELEEALELVDPLNIALLEEQVTKHDQLAVLEELGRFVSPETKALLHPGTTSYDILDSARSYLFKGAWRDVICPEISHAISQVCDISERSMDIIQVGRTHLQDTSPVLFGGVLAGYAARLAERMNKCNQYFNDLRGKVSGIVGTGASINMVIGKDKSFGFEEAVLKKLELKPDYTATQVVQKERLADVGHGLVSLMHVLGDLANDMRMLYSSAIGEVTSRDNAERLGGSSADATKNNPINWENIAGKVVIVESGMRVLYEMIKSDFQRDLRGSVQARYQPQQMMAETYEAFVRLNKVLPQLSINEDKMKANLQSIRENPSEAMVAILRGTGYIHPEYGVGHDFVKVIGKTAKTNGRKLIDVAMDDTHFREFYPSLLESQRNILQGNLEGYLGSAWKRAKANRTYARSVI